ncbi:MAG: hypothetical protein JXA67_10910, partial [Micromonosporaceae bacterium]|nr:hypothetical protein [Micromonosporaceae bacterium]
GLDVFWSYLVFFALDAAAGVCVLMTLILAARGDRAGAFGPLVWVFAFASAFAGYRHGTGDGAPRDAWWFFPLMSVLGPVLLHLVLGHVRRDAQLGSRRRLAFASASAYRLGRWIPGVGAFAETFCAWRVGRLEGITTPVEAIDRYRQLCPDGQWRVLRAMRREAAALRAPAATTGEPVTTSLAAGDATSALVLSTVAEPVVDNDARSTVHLLSPIVGDVSASAGDTVSAGATPIQATGRASGKGSGQAGTTQRGARPVRRVPTPERIARAVARTPDASPAQIAARLRLSERTVQRYLPRGNGAALMTSTPMTTAQTA